MTGKSKAEAALKIHLRAYNIEFQEEYKFHPTRRWRFDFAMPEIKLAIEVEGITHYGKNKDGSMRLGRHQTAKGIEQDCIKYGAAMELGWDVYRCTQGMVSKGAAIDTILKLIALKNVSHETSQ